MGKINYLSIDLEATGLNEKDYIIEFAAFPFDPYHFQAPIPSHLFFHESIWCPSFQELSPSLDPWVKEHNQDLIQKAHNGGLSHDQFRLKLQHYLEQKELLDFFGLTSYDNENKIILFGKSMSALDLPFLNRDLGWNFMRKYFSHRNLDLSSVVIGLIDLGLLPPECIKGSELCKYLLNMDVAHNALDDAINCAKMYSLLINKIKILKT